MRRNWRSNRLSFFIFCMILSLGFILASLTGILRPVEDLFAQPLHAITHFFNDATLSLSSFIADFSEIQSLRDRKTELETELIRQQAELIELREIASDYQRLAALFEYTSRVENQEFLSADVIGIEQSSFARAIVINRGTRDGITVGMPVVTELGLVGRIIDVSANAARVQLISDPNSAVSARLQTSRAEGSVIGKLGADNLTMTFIPLGTQIIVGDLVFTSGLGGNLPPDLVIGQVVSSSQREFELFQEAIIRSRVNLEALEIVLVITSFQPIDLSVFEENGQ